MRFVSGKTPSIRVAELTGTASCHLSEVVDATGHPDVQGDCAKNAEDEQDIPGGVVEVFLFGLHFPCAEDDKVLCDCGGIHGFYISRAAL